MIEQSVLFPGLVLALGAIVVPGVPVESHFPWTHGEERKKKKGEDKHEPRDIVKQVIMSSLSFIYFGVGLPIRKSRNLT